MSISKIYNLKKQKQEGWYTYTCIYHNKLYEKKWKNDKIVHKNNKEDSEQ